jgi:hypothetical protein
MNLQTFEIEDRHKKFEVQIPQLEDFKLQEGDLISEQRVLENPNISLYGLDPKNRTAIFVETPIEVDLSQVPFYYMSQFANATRVILVPYRVLHNLARQIPLEGHQLILVYSVGRSGSTLTSAAFNEADGVIGLSEPDTFTKLTAMRAWDGSNDQEISELLKSCTHLTCKNPASKDEPQKWAIKFRSYGIEIGDLMYRLFPDAKCLFLYRNLEDWTDSMVRAFGGDEKITPEVVNLFWEFMKPLVKITASYSVENEKLSLAQVFGLHWLSPMERYLDLAEKGIPILPVRYEDMKQKTLSVMEKIFSYCGLETKDQDELKRVLEKDSQAGSPLGRDFTQDQEFNSKREVMKKLHELLATRPVINRSDFELPGTLVLE